MKTYYVREMTGKCGCVRAMDNGCMCLCDGGEVTPVAERAKLFGSRAAARIAMRREGLSPREWGVYVYQD